MDKEILHFNESYKKDRLHYIVDITEIDGKMYSKYSVYSLFTPLKDEGLSFFKTPDGTISIELDKYNQGNKKTDFTLTGNSLFYNAFASKLEHKDRFRLRTDEDKDHSILVSFIGNNINLKFDGFQENEQMKLILTNENTFWTGRSYRITDSIMQNMQECVKKELSHPHRIPRRKPL